MTLSQVLEGAFRVDIDFALLAKIYAASLDSSKRRYSPSECTGAVKMPIEGSADPRNISTSFVERQNLTMRISIRRFTRLTNAFSKKIEKHALSVAVHSMLCNFARTQKTFRNSPAMAAGINDKLWSVAAIVDMIDTAEKSNCRTPLKSFCLSKPSNRSTYTVPLV